MPTHSSGVGNVISCICMIYPQLEYPAISCCALLQSPFEEGNELGIKSVNCTALAVHHKSCLSARIRGIYWPSVKIEREDWMRNTLEMLKHRNVLRQIPFKF